MMHSIIDEVRLHAAEASPAECCGIVVVEEGARRYIRCTNIASDATNRFVIDPVEYAAIEDACAIEMIAHSHVFISPKASEADLVGCEKSGVPWLIVNHPTGNYEIVSPCGYKAPLIGRTFCKGTLDCYELVKDYFEIKLGITLPDYVRPEVWFEEGRSILIENFEAFGFKEISMSEVRENDCFLMQVGADVPNHCAVYIGENKILHHVADRLSSRDVYGSFWRKATTHCLRYVG